MIEYIEGNIFDSPAQVIVNTVNTVGVMGKGLALEFKARYPQMFEKYKEACEKKSLKIGKLMLVSASDHLLLLFPTKENWRFPSKLSYIEKGLKCFCDNYAQRGITSIAFPKLGCGNGDLNWEDVRPLMEKYLSPLPISIYIYLDKLSNEITPEHFTLKETQEWLRANAKDLSFNGMMDDLYTQCNLVPYEFNIENIKGILCFENNVFKITYKDKILAIDEEKLYQLWDEIRNQSIFAVDKSNVEFYLISHILYSLGYLSRIKKMDKSGNMLDGFQLKEGLGRTFVLGGRNS